MEPVLIEALIAELAVEALDVRVLRRLARFDQPQLDPMPIGPGIERLPGAASRECADSRSGDVSLPAQ